MSLILSWVLFPIVLAAVGAGWGVLVERLAGIRVSGALLIPLGLAAALVIAAIFTAFSPIAPASVPVVAVGAVAGLVWAWPLGRIGRWPAIAAIGAVAAYGAPVLLSGSATFAGYIRLDDTATWLAIVDRVMQHGRSVSGLPLSTYKLQLSADLGGAYPLGAFMLWGVGRDLTGIDAAWVFQPYLACCGAATGLCAYALIEPIVASPRLRALVAFLAAQPALLYGYSLWGGIKELTAAFLLACGAALLAATVTRRQRGPRELTALAFPAAGLIVTLGAGAAVWVLPAVLIAVVAWLRPWQGFGALRPTAISTAWLAGVTALLALPLWIVVGQFLSSDQGLFSSGETSAVKLGNLIAPLKAVQLVGIWPAGDFRLVAPGVTTGLLVGVAVLVAVGAVWATARRLELGIGVYAAVALLGCAIAYLIGSTPWVMGKSLAFSSPAVLTAALAGAALLWQRHPAGVAMLVVIGGGVIWSNVLQYHDVMLAPRARLAELQHIGGLVAGRGPTFQNEYEIYGDRHFLRDGDPVEPAEYRPVNLPLRNGALLTKAAFADLDSFPLSTLAPYRSLVVRRSPVESRPPSIYSLRWQGRYYQLWQQPAHPSQRVLEHIPYGDQNALPYCGASQTAATLPLCSIQPVGVPACSALVAIGRQARGLGAQLLAYQRPPPIVARGDDVLWPEAWIHDPVGHTLTPTTPGTAVAHIAVATGERYRLWLGGSFVRGFNVSIDGRYLGRVWNELSNVGTYVPIASRNLGPGVHTIALTYPHQGLDPGSGDIAHYEGTNLTEIALEPLQTPPAQLLRVAPAQARTLCGRPLDWVELVAPV